MKNLIEVGILSSSGELLDSGIDMVSGALAGSFLGVVKEVCDHDSATLEMIGELFEGLLLARQEDELLEAIRTIYSFTEFNFPGIFDMCSEYLDTKESLLVAFVEDYLECIQDEIGY